MVNRHASFIRIVIYLYWTTANVLVLASQNLRHRWPWIRKKNSERNSDVSENLEKDLNVSWFAECKFLWSWSPCIELNSRKVTYNLNHLFLFSSFVLFLLPNIILQDLCTALNSVLFFRLCESQPKSK